MTLGRTNYQQYQPTPNYQPLSMQDRLIGRRRERVAAAQNFSDSLVAGDILDEQDPVAPIPDIGPDAIPHISPETEDVIRKEQAEKPTRYAKHPILNGILGAASWYDRHIQKQLDSLALGGLSTLANPASAALGAIGGLQGRTPDPEDNSFFNLGSRYWQNLFKNSREIFQAGDDEWNGPLREFLEILPETYEDTHTPKYMKGLVEIFNPIDPVGWVTWKVGGLALRSAGRTATRLGRKGIDTASAKFDTKIGQITEIEGVDPKVDLGGKVPDLGKIIDKRHPQDIINELKEQYTYGDFNIKKFSTYGGAILGFLQDWPSALDLINPLYHFLPAALDRTDGGRLVLAYAKNRSTIDSVMADQRFRMTNVVEMADFETALKVRDDGQAAQIILRGPANRGPLHKAERSKFAFQIDELGAVANLKPGALTERAAREGENNYLKEAYLFEHFIKDAEIIEKLPTGEQKAVAEVMESLDPTQQKGYADIVDLIEHTKAYLLNDLQVPEQFVNKFTPYRPRLVKGSPELDEMELEDALRMLIKERTGVSAEILEPFFLQDRKFKRIIDGLRAGYSYEDPSHAALSFMRLALELENLTKFAEGLEHIAVRNVRAEMQNAEHKINAITALDNLLGLAASRRDAKGRVVGLGEYFDNIANLGDDALAGRVDDLRGEFKELDVLFKELEIEGEGVEHTLRPLLAMLGKAMKIDAEIAPSDAVATWVANLLSDGKMLRPVSSNFAGKLRRLGTKRMQAITKELHALGRYEVELEDLRKSIESMQQQRGMVKDAKSLSAKQKAERINELTRQINNANAAYRRRVRNKGDFFVKETGKLDQSTSTARRAALKQEMLEEWRDMVNFERVPRNFDEALRYLEGKKSKAARHAEHQILEWQGVSAARRAMVEQFGDQFQTIRNYEKRGKLDRFRKVPYDVRSRYKQLDKELKREARELGIEGRGTRTERRTRRAARPSGSEFAQTVNNPQMKWDPETQSFFVPDDQTRHVPVDEWQPHMNDNPNYVPEFKAAGVDGDELGDDVFELNAEKLGDSDDFAEVIDEILEVDETFDSVFDRFDHAKLGTLAPELFRPSEAILGRTSKLLTQIKAQAGSYKGVGKTGRKPRSSKAGPKRKPDPVKREDVMGIIMLRTAITDGWDANAHRPISSRGKAVIRALTKMQGYHRHFNSRRSKHIQEGATLERLSNQTLIELPTGPEKDAPLRKYKQLERERAGEGLFPLSQGIFLEKAAVREIQSRLSIPNNKATNTIQFFASVSGFLKTLRSVVDVGAPAIHGMLMISVAPEVWGKAVVLGLRSMIEPAKLGEYLNRPENFAIVQKYLPEGLRLGNVRELELPALAGANDEYLGGKGPIGALGDMAYRASREADSGTRSEKVFKKTGDVLRKTEHGTYTFLGYPERNFTAFRTIMAIEYMKAFERSYLNAGGTLAGFAAHTNKMTGFYDQTAAGFSRLQLSTERAFSQFSPRYTRSVLALVVDAFRGGVDGEFARNAIFSQVLYMPMIYSAWSYALGQEPKLDPRPKSAGGDGAEFMTVDIFGQNIGFGSTWVALYRLAGDILSKDEDLFDLVNPTKGRDNPFIKFMMSRSAPSAQIMRDLFTGQTYIGDELETPLDYGAFAASNLSPFWVESALLSDGGVVGTNGGSLMGGLAEFIGLRSYPMSTYERLDHARNQGAAEMFGEGFIQTPTWNDLNKLQQRRVENNPKYGIRELKDMLGDRNSSDRMSILLDSYFEQDRQIRDNHAAGINAAQQQVGVTQDTLWFREETRYLSEVAYAQRQLLRSGAYQEVVDTLNRDWQDGTRNYPTEDLAYFEYLQTVFFNPDLHFEDGTYDFRMRNLLENRFMERWGPEVFEYVQLALDERLASPDTGHPDLMKEMTRGRRVFDFYWTASIDAAVEASRNPNEMRERLNDWYMANKTERRRMLDEDRELYEAKEMSERIRRKLREKHPDLDIFIYRFYGGEETTLVHPNNQWEGALDFYRTARYLEFPYANFVDIPTQ